MNGQTDWLSEQGAKWLARRIENFWAKLGHKVNVTIEPVPGFKQEVFVVRSDMVGGRPRVR